MIDLDVAGFVFILVSTQLLKKYLDQHNFVYQLCIMIKHACIPLKILIINVFFCLQTVFSNFFHGQMLFHAKALELYTTAFQSLLSMDEEQDVEV